VKIFLFLLQQLYNIYNCPSSKPETNQDKAAIGADCAASAVMCKMSHFPIMPVVWSVSPSYILTLPPGVHCEEMHVLFLYFSKGSMEVSDVSSYEITMNNIYDTKTVKITRPGSNFL